MRFGWIDKIIYIVRGYSIFCTGETQSDLQDMDLPIYPRSAFGPSGPGLCFGVGVEGPGYFIGHIIPLSLASGMVSLFFSPYQIIF